jgi:hypothetical protein
MNKLRILIPLLLVVAFMASGCVTTSHKFNLDEALGIKPKAEYLFGHDGSLESTNRMRTWLGPLAGYMNQWTLKELHAAFTSPPIGYQSVSMDGGRGQVTTSATQEPTGTRVALVIHYDGYGKNPDIWRALTAEQIRPGHWVPVLNPEIPETEHLRSIHEYRLQQGKE